MARRTSRIPLSAVLLAVFGVLVLLGGVFALGGSLRHVHPLLNRDGGLALLVSGVALILTAAFPIAIARLAAQPSKTE